LSDSLHARKPFALDNALKSIRLEIVYRLFNPQVPVIICAKSGRDVAATPANSCSSASDSPPMVSLALKRGTRTNYVLRSSLRFSMNWINFKPESSRKIVPKLAKPSDPRAKAFDKLKQNKIPYVTLQKTPFLKQACAFALCTVEKRITTGDHDLFISRVTHARAIDDFVEDEYWRFETYKPILYVGSIRPNPLITIG
jgi:flavin reductase (DIM6/NTAB) family NADH-FMN oxidoreductase RutF